MIPIVFKIGASIIGSVIFSGVIVYLVRQKLVKRKLAYYNAFSKSETKDCIAKALASDVDVVATPQLLCEVLSSDTVVMRGVPQSFLEGSGFFMGEDEDGEVCLLCKVTQSDMKMWKDFELRYIAERSGLPKNDFCDIDEEGNIFLKGEAKKVLVPGKIIIED